MSTATMDCASCRKRRLRFHGLCVVCQYRGRNGCAPRRRRCEPDYMMRAVEVLVVVLMTIGVFGLTATLPQAQMFIARFQ